MKTILFSYILLIMIATGTALASYNAPAVLVLGDSLSAAHGIPVDAGWVHLLALKLHHDGYPYHVVNASIGGDTTAGGLARLPAAINRYHPSIVIIELGGNDGLRGTPITTFRRQLEELALTAKRSGAQVLILGVRLPPNYGPIYTQKFHQVFFSVAEKTRVSLAPYLLKNVASHRRLMQSDGIHPTAAAQHLLLNNVWDKLHSLLQR